jgi:hypothetical protein
LADEHTAKRPRSCLAASQFMWCLFAAAIAFVAASILLMTVAHILSRDVDRLYRTRQQIDPNAVVPVDDAVES